MKLFRILSRNIRDSFKSVFRNFSLSLASISCITITLVVVAIAIALSYNVNGFTRKVEKDVTMVVFLNEDISEERFKEIGDEIRKIDNVGKKESDVVGKTKMQVRDEMMKSSETYASILDKYDTRDTNFLKDTYHIKVEDITKMSKTAKTIKKEIKEVDTVKYGEGMIEKLVTIFDFVRKATYVVVIALILVTAS